jgi:hypothetical protein
MNSCADAADTLSMLRRPAIIVLSVATGFALEMGVQLASGRREAWDSPIYWSVGLPAAALAALLIGFAARRPAWFWTVLIAPSQVLTMMLRSGEIGNLWPLALVLSSILSAPFVAASFIGSRLRRSA